MTEPELRKRASSSEPTSSLTPAWLSGFSTGRQHPVQRCAIDVGLATRRAVDPVPVLILKCKQPVLLQHVF